MIDTYYKDGRLQWRTYCSTCHALIDDTAPMAEHDRDSLISGICPRCGGKLHDDKKDKLFTFPSPPV